MTTLGGCALAVSATFHPVSEETLSLVCALYVTLVIAGVMFPRLQMHADTVTRTDDDGIALTFDDGPHPETTRLVLGHLRERGMTATFFLIGAKVAKYPDVAREIVEQGHEVALHTYDHEWMYPFKSPRAVEADIARTQAAIYAACGVRPILFRPPVGMTSPRTAEGARRAGARIVAWSTRGLDGTAGRSNASVLRRLQRGLRPGAIALLHDASELDDFVPPSLGILPELLDHIIARGLPTRRLSDALASGRHVLHASDERRFDEAPVLAESRFS